MAPTDPRRVSVAITSGNTLCGFRSERGPDDAREKFESSVRRLRASGRGPGSSVVVASRGKRRQYATIGAADFDADVGSGEAASLRETMKFPARIVP